MKKGQCAPSEYYSAFAKYVSISAINSLPVCANESCSTRKERETFCDMRLERVNNK